MNFFQNLFQLYLNTITQFFNSYFINDIFVIQFLHSFLFLMFFSMIIFVTFVPVYYTIYLLFNIIICNFKKGGGI